MVYIFKNVNLDFLGQKQLYLFGVLLFGIFSQNLAIKNDPNQKSEPDLSQFYDEKKNPF